MNVSIGWVLILIGVILFVLTAVGFRLPSIDLWVLGWALIVAGALLFDRSAPSR